MASEQKMIAKSRRVPLELRRRTENSCDRCKTRKQKCIIGPDDKKCRHCLKYSYECAVTKPRKQRSYGGLETHGTRLVVLESLVRALAPEVDTSDLESIKEMGRSLGISPPDAAASAAEGQNSTAIVGKHPVKEDEQLVHDLQGQDQYIGRSSSYYFQMKLRALVGRNHDGTIGRMYLFGPNPASMRPHPGSVLSVEDHMESIGFTPFSESPSSSGVSPSIEAPQADSSTISLLVRAFFERINVDFPVLHEATFLEGLDEWHQSPSVTDPTWLGTFLCVLILARRVCNVPLPEDQEERWWSQIQSLLSKVIFTSSLASIQALMLAALHLHNTNSRDTCWTLTGAAVRIGFAIGLHRDISDSKGTPLTREMRKRVWWTLYSFEQLQVSSHDRPSAIDNARYLCGSPRETILDMGSYSPPEYGTWSNRLLVMLGGACRALPDTAKGGYSGPSSPAAGLLRELSQWRTSLPRHLRMDIIEAMPPSFHRPLVLLHVQYHYIASLISRNALLSRFTGILKKETEAVSESLVSMSEVCIESGRLSCQLLLKLDSMDSFNAVTWWDTYYLYSSTLVLALSIMCDAGQGRRESAMESQKLLHCCTETATKHLANAMVPGTMRRWLHVVLELNTMIIEFTQRHTGQSRVMSSIEDAEATVPEFGAEAMQLLSSSGPQPRELFATVATNDRRTTTNPGTWMPLVFDQDFSALEPDFTGLSLPAGSDSWGGTSPSRGPFGMQLWPEMHWEGISDMLLGTDPRTWYS